MEILSDYCLPKILVIEWQYFNTQLIEVGNDDALIGGVNTVLVQYGW